MQREEFARLERAGRELGCGVGEARLRDRARHSLGGQSGVVTFCELVNGAC